MATLLTAVILAGPRPASLTAQSADPAAGLRLGDVYELARQSSPTLRSASTMADAAGAREASAGLPPDPMIQLGIMNFSVPGFDTGMPNSMAPAIQAMQTLPLFGKLGLAERIAELETAELLAGADEAWWSVRARTAAAFYSVYEADRQLVAMRESLGLLRDFESVAHAMYATGSGRQSDVLRAGVEVTRMIADITRMESMRTAAAARLNGVLGRPADSPVGQTVLSPLPLDIPPLDTLAGWARQDRPALLRGRTTIERARSRSELVRREIWPDPVIGLQYGQRSRNGDTERMGSIMVGFSIPVFAGRRQVRLRDESAALEAVARAELAGLEADVDARLLELGAELDRTRTLVRLYRAEILPQANANVESSLSAYRVGSVDFTTLVEAELAVNGYERELITLLADYGRFIAELEATVGRELPAAQSVLAEES